MARTAEPCLRFGTLGSAMSVDPRLAALLGLSDAAWNTGDGLPMMITYAFAADGFSPIQQASARAALAAWAAPTGLSVQEVPDITGADLVFRIGALDTPWTTGTTDFFDDRTEITLSLPIYGTDSLAPGRRGFETLLHEIGHALGLSHPFEGPDAFAATRDDSVMAYERGILANATAPRTLDLEAAIALWGSAAEEAAGPHRWWDGTVLHHEGTGLLRGTAWQDAILGGPGDDVLEGRGGDDWLAPGGGADRVDGGGGGLDTLRLEVLGRELTLLAHPDAAGGMAGWAGAVAIASVEAIDLVDGRYAFSPADPQALASRILAVLSPGASFGPQDAAALGRIAFPLLRGEVPQPLVDLPGIDIGDLYATLLHRAPEAEALAFWTGHLANDGAAAVVLAVAGSAEAIKVNPVDALWALRPDALGIDRLYQTAFGRRAEAGGLEFWARVAPDPLAVAEGLAGSAEFSPVAARGSGGLVAALYEHAFARAPDAAGLEFWQGALAAATVTVADVLDAFATSPEMLEHWGVVFA